MATLKGNEPGNDKDGASTEHVDNEVTGSDTSKNLRAQIRQELTSDFESMKQDLRNSISGEQPGVSTSASRQNPLQQSEQAVPSMKNVKRDPCAICGGSRDCYHCAGTGLIWEQACRQCSGSGKCYACLYSY